MSKRNYILAGFAVIALALGIWWLAGSGTAPEPAPSSPEAGKAAPGVLPVDRRQAAQLGIRLAPALTASEAPIAVIPAVIQPPANARVAVAATFPGVVMRTLVVEGDTVRQGQPLAVISSRDVLTMGADLTRANARAGVARSGSRSLPAKASSPARALMKPMHWRPKQAPMSPKRRASSKWSMARGGAAPIR